MPLFVAAALRYVLIAAVQIGAFAAAQTFLESALGAIRNALMQGEGMTADQADESIAIEIAAAGGALGANAAIIRSRLPLRIADKLKLAVGKPTISARGSVSTPQSTTPTASLLYKGSLLKTLGVVAASSAVAKLFWLDTTIQNFLDQGTFNPKGANKALQAIGLGGVFQWPETPTELQPGTYTASEFLELFEQLTAAGAVGINNEFEQQSQTWTKDNLSALVNTIVGDLIIRGKKSDKAAIKTELARYVVTRGGGSTPAPSSGSSGAPLSTPQNVAPSVKIFTGIVASGALGAPRAFESATDGYITSDDDLKATISQTLANFVLTLPAQFKYEVAIVSTFRSPGGFSLKGEAVQVTTGYYKDGRPKTKTIYKKFAVLKVYLYDQNGRKVILLTENCGQVDSGSYSPTPAALASISRTLSTDIFTTDVGEIKGVVPAAPSSVPPAPAGSAVISGSNNTSQIPPAPAPVPVPASSPAPTPAPAPPAIRATVPLNEAYDVEFSYGYMGTVYEDYLLKKYNITQEDLHAVNQDIKQRLGSVRLSGDLSVLMRNFGISTVNIPVSRSSQAAPAATPAPGIPGLQGGVPFNQYASTPIAPATTTPAGPVQTQPPTQWRTNTGAENLNIRSLPGTSSAIADKLPNSSLVAVLEQAGVKDGYNWVRISYFKDGGARYGYVADQFLTRA